MWKFEVGRLEEKDEKLMIGMGRAKTSARLEEEMWKQEAEKDEEDEELVHEEDEEEEEEEGSERMCKRTS